MKILEEFWYGNIEPTDYDTSSCKEYKIILISNMKKSPSIDILLIDGLFVLR